MPFILIQDWFREFAEHDPVRLFCFRTLLQLRDSQLMDSFDSNIEASLPFTDIIQRNIINISTVFS